MFYALCSFNLGENIASPLLDWLDLIPSKGNSIKLVSTSVANLVQVRCRSNMWPGYVITTRSCCKSGSSLRTKLCVLGVDGGGSKRESWHQLSCEIVFNRRYNLNAATPTHSMWYAYFSRLSGFTFHTLSSLGILGSADLKWLRAERNLSGIQLAPCAPELRFLYGCVIREKRTGDIGRCWERGKEEKKGGGRKREQGRERAGSPGFLSLPLRHAVLSLTHRPAF